MFARCVRGRNMRPPSSPSMKVELQPFCQPQMPTVMVPGARWQMSTAGVHFKMPHACSVHMGAPCRAPEGFQRPVCFCSKFRHEVQSNWPMFYFPLSGTFKQGPPSSSQSERGERSRRVICAHARHLATTPNPTLPSCFMGFNLKIADSICKRTPGTVPTIKYISSIREHFVIYHFLGEETRNYAVLSK